MEPFQPKKTEDELVGEVLLEKAIKRKLNKPRKQVKFTWEGLKNTIPKHTCLLYTSPSPRDRTRSRMPSSA